MEIKHPALYSTPLLFLILFKVTGYRHKKLRIWNSIHRSDCDFRFLFWPNESLMSSKD